MAVGAWGVGARIFCRLPLATCQQESLHSPFHPPACLPSQPCLIKWDLVGTAGTSATVGKTPQPNKSSPIEGRGSPWLWPQDSTSCSSIAREPNAFLLHSLVNNSPRTPIWGRTLAPQGTWQLRIEGVEVGVGAGSKNVGWTPAPSLDFFTIPNNFPLEPGRKFH